MSPTVSVVLTTGGRPDAASECLRHLAAGTAPHQVVVVDASGGRPAARAAGLRAATGDVVAFLDDDVRPDPTWLDELTAPYADPAVAGVGGRVTTGEPCKAGGPVGRLLPDGRLLGGFGADPGRVVEVHHLPGATASYRRQVLLDVGGPRGGYAGTRRCEEADLAFRVRAAGGRLVLAPRAVVRRDQQPGAPRPGLRRLHAVRRDHVLLLSRTFGLSSPELRRYVRTTLREQQGHWWTARSRLRHGRDDQGRTGLRVRLLAPLVLVLPVVELAGLAAGFVAARGGAS